MLNFTDLTIRRGQRPLFSGATFSLFRGEKVGITGENGSGKSSLHVAGARRAAAGCRHASRCPRNLSIAHVSQELEATDRRRSSSCSTATPSCARSSAQIAAAEARRRRRQARRAVRALRRRRRLRRAQPRRATHARPGLSRRGRNARRCASSPAAGACASTSRKALMCRSDLLLLDEPTNHLDLDAILWLEGWLRDYPGTLLLIAHDREFLDRVVNRIVNIEHGKARAYRGNYSAVRRSARRRARRAGGAVRAPAARDQAHGVLRRALSRQGDQGAPGAEPPQGARAHAAHRAGACGLAVRVLVRAARRSCRGRCSRSRQQSAGYGERAVLEGVNLTHRAGRPHRRCSGATAPASRRFMKLLAGELAALAGTRTEARDLRIGYFAQHQLEQLVASDSPLGNLRRFERCALAARATEQELRDYLGRLRFSRRSGVRARRRRSRAARRRGWCWRWWPTGGRTCCCWTSRPTTSTSRCARRWRWRCRTTKAPSCWCRTTGTCCAPWCDEFLLVAHGRAAPFDGDLDDYARWLAAGAPPMTAPAAARSGPSAARATPDSAETPQAAQARRGPAAGGAGAGAGGHRRTRTAARTPERGALAPRSRADRGHHHRG